MATNKKINWLVTAVILLALVNLAALGFIWLGKPKSEQRNGDARSFLIAELKLNDQQTKQFDNFRDEHFGKMKSYQENMRQLKDNFFNQVSQPVTNIDSLAEKIGKMQALIDLETFQHFSKLRSILNEDQRKKFDNIIQEVIRTMGPRGGPPPGGRPPERGSPPPDALPH